MTVNTPKDPIDGVTEWTNEETGIKYRYIGGAWRAVSSKAAQDVADALGQLDLEKVLTNGNVADEDIYLTHIASSDSDIIDVSPEKAKVVIATEGNKVPTFELQHYAVDDNSQVKLELDEDGTRFDIECDEKVNNIHFRFEEEDKLILNKDGDAVFTGKVEVEPGTAGNEAVTYNQLVEIEEELESLVPSIERGKYDLLMENITVDDTGKFNLYEGFSEEEKRRREQACEDTRDACIRNPDLDEIDCQTDYDRCILRIPIVGTGHYVTDNFATVNRIKFNLQDVDGVTHNWESIKPGMMIDVFNEEDDSYMLAEVTATNGMWYEMVDIDVNVIQHKGKATGRCRIKVFELDLSAGSDTDFIRKQGSNEVTDNWKITSGGKTFFHVQGGESKVYYLQDPSHDKHPVTRGYADTNYVKKSGDSVSGDLVVEKRLWVKPPGTSTNGWNSGNVFIVNQQDATEGSIVRIKQNNKDKLKVDIDGNTSLENNKLIKIAAPEDDTDGANKAYVDSQVAANSSPADLAFGRKFKYAYNSTDPRDGDGYCYFGNNYLYLSIKDKNELSYQVNCDNYTDREITGSGQKHPIMICQQNDEGIWQLIGSGYWPGETDCREEYIYIKGINWTRSNFVKGQEYRIKVSPFW